MVTTDMLCCKWYLKLLVIFIINWVFLIFSLKLSILNIIYYIIPAEQLAYLLVWWQLDLSLSEVFYKWLLGQEQTLQIDGLASICPMLAQSFGQLYDVVRQRRRVEADKSHVRGIFLLAIIQIYLWLVQNWRWSLWLDGCLRYLSFIFQSNPAKLRLLCLSRVGRRQVGKVERPPCRSQNGSSSLTVPSIGVCVFNVFCISFQLTEWKINI